MHLDIEKIKRESVGKWGGIIESLGVDVPMPYGNHGKCPIENDGKDRFRVDKDFNQRGTYFCNQCSPQSGDGFSLLQRVFGWTFLECAEKIRNIIGSVEFVPEPKEIDETKKRELMNKIWKQSMPLTGGDVVSKYLRLRGIVINPDQSQVRHNPVCYESESKKEIDAMVCMIRDQSGKPIGLHRTYLLPNGEKADIKSPRKSIGNTACGTIRLMPAKDVIGIAEGIESALSAAQLFDMPVWAVISAGGMESFYPPEGIRKIVVYGDNDATFTGQKSAYNLAHKLYIKNFIIDDPQIPEIRGEDWNDVLLRNLRK